MVCRHDYMPYGEEYTTCSDGETHLFTGHGHDAETGLDHFWFRQYDTKQGRWLSVDPLPGSSDAPQSLNRYAYVLNDRVNLVDPLGLQWEWLEDAACVLNFIYFSGSDPRTAGESIWVDAFIHCGLIKLTKEKLGWTPDREPHGGPGGTGPGRGDRRRCAQDPSAPGCALAPPVIPCVDSSNAIHLLNNQMDITTAAWRGFSGFGQVANAPITGVISESKPTGTGPYPPSAPPEFAREATHVAITSGLVTVTLVHVATPIPVEATVYQGQPFGVVTATGRLSEAHVHLEYSYGGNLQDPRPLLPDCRPPRGPG